MKIPACHPLRTHPPEVSMTNRKIALVGLCLLFGVTLMPVHAFPAQPGDSLTVESVAAAERVDRH